MKQCYRKMFTLCLGSVLAGSMATMAWAQGEVEVSDSGIARLTSTDSLEAVESRFKEGLEKRGMGLMASVDHQANAAGVELELPATRTYIFGKPEVKGHRRMAVALATGRTVAEARRKAKASASHLKVG